MRSILVAVSKSVCYGHGNRISSLEKLLKKSREVKGGRKQIRKWIVLEILIFREIHALPRFCDWTACWVASTLVTYAAVVAATAVMIADPNIRTGRSAGTNFTRVPRLAKPGTPIVAPKVANGIACGLTHMTDDNGMARFAARHGQHIHCKLPACAIGVPVTILDAGVGTSDDVEGIVVTRKASDNRCCHCCCLWLVEE